MSGAAKKLERELDPWKNGVQLGAEELSINMQMFFLGSQKRQLLHNCRFLQGNYPAASSRQGTYLCSGVPSGSR